MDGKIDLVVIANHGAGQNALCYFLNQIRPAISTHIASGQYASEQSVAAWLDRAGLGKAIFFDSRTPLADDKFRNYVFENLSDSCQFITLVRDPLQRLKSVVNTHIYWWACAASGLYHFQPGQTLLFRSRNINNLLSHLMAEPTMNVLADACQYLGAWRDRLRVLSIADLRHDRINKAFAPIYKAIYGAGFNPVDIPEAPAFNMINNFPRFIARKQIRITDFDLSIFVCPVEFLDAYVINKEAVIAEMDPASCGFNIGKFAGKIAFILDSGAVYPAEIKNHLRSYLAGHHKILQDYCKELSERSQLARQTGEALWLTDEKLLQYAHTNRNLAKQLASYLEQDIAGIRECDASKISVCKESIAFLDKMKRALVAC